MLRSSVFMGSAACMHTVLALLIFAFTYVLITGRRLRYLNLDRPSGALFGAVLMVGAGILSPERAYQVIHHGTIALLLGMMVLSVHLVKANFFEWVAWHVLRLARTPTALLHLTVWTAGLLSALLVNDTVCLVLTPLVIAVWSGAGLPLLPGLLALSTGANIGSAIAETGNPQNMIIAQLSGISFARFALLSLPAGLVGLALDGLLLQWMFRASLREATARPVTLEPVVDRPLLLRSMVVLAVVVTGFLAGFDLGWTALFGAALLITVGGLKPRDTFAQVDWPLLVFFAGLFVVMGGLGEAGVVEALGRKSAPLLDGGGLEPVLHLTWLTMLGSQVVSNVPWVMLVGGWIPTLADPEAMWLVLALTSTYAGNLTLLGSVANIIVLEGARDRVSIGFWRWLWFGIPITLVTTVAGLAVLLATLALR